MTLTPSVSCTKNVYEIDHDVNVNRHFSIGLVSLKCIHPLKLSQMSLTFASKGRRLQHEGMATSPRISDKEKVF